MSPQELDGLLAAHFAGTLDAEGQKLLGEALLADESARRRFVELSDQEAALRTLKAAELRALGAGRKEAQNAQGDACQGPAPLASTPCASCASLRQSADHTSPKPKAESPKPKAGRSGWLVPAVAAAVLIVVSGLFAFGILPSGSVTIREFGNSTDRVKKETLSDGTKLAIAPGAVLKAAGRDKARKVRQLIKLASGEVEVTAPKAASGEVACRVETPEGLWVETVGTVFKVTRTWENEKGERNVDKSKLTGAVFTAVLLVAVSEGEVRTGNAVAEEGTVAAGDDAVLKPAAGQTAYDYYDPRSVKVLGEGAVELGIELVVRIPESADYYFPGASYEKVGGMIKYRLVRARSGTAPAVAVKALPFESEANAHRLVFPVDWKKTRQAELVDSRGKRHGAWTPEAEAEEKVSWGQAVGDGLRLGVSPGRLPLAAGQASFKVTLWWENTGKEAVEAPVFKPYGDSNLTGLHLIGKKGSDAFSLDAAKATSAMLRSQMPGDRKLKPGERFSEELELPFAASALYKPPALTEGESLTLHFQVDRALKLAPPKAQPSITSGDITLTGAAKAEEKASWGQTVGGLQAGLSAKQVRFEPGKPIGLALHLANRGAGGVRVQDGLQPRAWRIEFAPAAGGQSILAALEALPKNREPAEAALPKGGETKLGLSIGRPEWVFGTVGLLDEMAALPPGKYTATASYEHAEHALRGECPYWHGKVTAGPVEIEIAAAGGAEAVPPWSEAVNGLRGRIEAEKSTIMRGDDIKLTFWLRADEKQKESLHVWDNKYSNGYRNDAYLVQTPAGAQLVLCQPVQNAWDKNSPHPVELKPGVPVKLEGWTGSLKSLKAMGLDTTKTGAGPYIITGIYEETGDGKMWGGKFTTPPIKVTVEAAKAGAPAAEGGWIELLADQPAYKEKPGEEQLLTGRLDLLRPITELHNFAYALVPGDGTKERFTLGVGILPALEKLKAAELAAGRAPVVQVRGKVEKDVQLYKGDGGKGVVLWPAAIRLAAEPASAPSFSAKCRQAADKVAAEVSGGALILTVTSPGGIGSAEVKPEKGEWPKKVTVRLGLKGLEGFSAECGGKKLAGRLGGAAGGKEELAAEKKGELVEVALPEGFAAGKDAVLKISWVDFYR